MNLIDTNYHWKHLVDWMFDTWWDKILQPQKWTFCEKEPKKLKNITIFYFMTTFHNVALKIETIFKLERFFKSIMKTRKVNDKR